MSVTTENALFFLFILSAFSLTKWTFFKACKKWFLTSFELLDFGKILKLSWIYVGTPIFSKKSMVSEEENFEKTEYKNFSPRG